MTSIFNYFLSYLVIWYNQGREEISSITQTLQSREFGEITMAKNAFAAGDTPSPHPTLLDAFGALICYSANRFAPVVQSKNILKLYFSLNYNLNRPIDVHYLLALYYVGQKLHPFIF